MNQELTPESVRDLMMLAKLATPGPWVPGSATSDIDGFDEQWPLYPPGNRDPETRPVAVAMSRNDRLLIQACQNIIPTLCAALLKAWEKNDALQLEIVSDRLGEREGYGQTYVGPDNGEDD